MTHQTGSVLETVKQWFHELWEEADTAAINALSNSGTTMQGAISELAAPQNYGEVVTALNDLPKNIHFEYAYPVEQGEWVAVKLIVQAQSAATGDDVRFTGQIIARVKEAIVTELIATIDYMKMFEQLGQLPEDSLPICLTGEQLIWAQ